MNELPEALVGGLDIYPWANRRILIYRNPTKSGDNIISVCRLTDPSEMNLDGGRFSNLRGEVYENAVRLDIPHAYGCNPDDEDPNGMSGLFDWVAAEVVGGWSLYYAQREFSPSESALSFKSTMPYPVLLFEDAATAVKLKLLRG
jgi:hypothetical protein